MEEIIKILNENNIRYLVIGGQALRLYGMPRFTMDWDLFIPKNDNANLDRINEKLESHLDYPVVTLGPKGKNFVQTYQTLFGVLQFHLIPPGIPDFDEAEKLSVTLKTESGCPVKCVSAKHLLNSKLKTERAKDEDDITYLKRFLESK